MTPKEKAIELYEKFRFENPDRLELMHLAEKRAMIVCDEVLSALKICWDEQGAYIQHEYWSNVKLELERLS
jgi:hypothetical protein